MKTNFESDPFLRLSQLLNERSTRTSIIIMLVVLTLDILGGVLVYKTGGSHLSYIHAMYIPIILCGFYFGVWMGLSNGILAAFIVGPLMPESVELHVIQSTEIWLFRLCFFSIIGAFAGSFSQLTQSYFALLEHQFLTDPITNLPNFRGLQRYMERFHQNYDQVRGIILFKIRDVGDIDKAFGPAYVETLLKSVADMFNSHKSSGFVARLDGAKFAVMVDKSQDADQVIHLCQEIFESSLQRLEVPVFLQFFQGYAPYMPGDTLNALIRKASNTLDRAMAQNQGVLHYDPSQDEVAERNVSLLYALKAAIAQKQLVLNYQPKISLKTGEIVGLEALVRWNHPELGHISPTEFIPLAEKTQLIQPFTSWLIDVSFAQLAAWRERECPISLSINFSMHNFLEPEILDKLIKTMNHYHIPSQMVEIEITENALSSNIGNVADILKYLQEKGFRIAVDDFGTGMSSLSYLFELPLNAIKIDRVFVAAMNHNSAAEAIVRSAVTLGHELDLEVIAEGIETLEQVEALRTFGCDVGQGYYFSRPMPAELTTAWLDSRKNQIARVDDAV
jgi:EAL domain-containing protein (putative c-di-GMP-specific phosphodiesterase class I)/GGDEF domain-containing protein